jgi:hypothetical protein
VSFEVGNLDAVVDELAMDGYGLVGGIGEYENSVRMAYVRGPEGIIVSLFEQIDWRACALPTLGRSAAYARQPIPMRARVVACLLQLATVDLTLRRYDTDGHRSDEHRAERKPALSVQRERRDCSARTTIPPRDLQC